MANENVVHEEEYKGYTIKILPDDDGMSPVKEFDMAGKMVCWHNRYNLGHEQSRLSPPEWIVDFVVKNCKISDSQWDKYNNDEFLPSECWKIAEQQYIFLPLNLYDHSGISISTSSFVGRAQHAEWDSGQVGWIYISKENAVKEFGKKLYTKTVEKKAIDCLNAEVKTYDDYLTGNVYGYQVCDSDGEVLDSCWGFYPDHDDKTGWDYCLSEAKGQADWLVKEKQEEQNKSDQLLAIAQAHA